MSQEPEEKGFTVVDRRISFDGDDEEGDVEPAREKKPAYVEQLEGEIDELRTRESEMKAQYRAALEEFENAKARSSRDAALEIRKGRKSVLSEVIEILDNLDRAIEAGGEVADEAFLEGIKLVREQFLGKLEHLGAHRMSSMGEPFDPEMHQAVSMVPVDDPEQDGKVVGVITEGYRFEDELLRPALVAVGKAAD